MLEESPVREGDVVADKYRVTRVLGAGGMGVVVAATHLELGQPVALKFLLESLADRPQLVERFIREARNCVSINSEHVVRVTDVGRLASGSPFMVMEFLEGHDLETELQKEGPLRTGRAVDYALQTCVGLAEAHVRHLIHRDLKPANLFLTTRSDGYKLLKILDFGISKSLIGTKDQALTQTNQSMGTPYYMSPEQIRAAVNIDGRTDIWSLGAILYEVLSGRPPFAANTASAVCAQVLEASPAELTGLRPDVPEPLWQVIAWCMRKRAEDRPQNVAELAAALAPFAVHERDTHARVARILGLQAPSSTTYLLAAEPAFAPHRAGQGLETGYAPLSDAMGSAPGVGGQFPGETDAPFTRTGSTEVRGNSKRKWFALGGAALIFVAALIFSLSSGTADQPPLTTASDAPGIVTTSPALAPPVGALPMQQPKPVQAQPTPEVEQRTPEVKQRTPEVEQPPATPKTTKAVPSKTPRIARPARRPPKPTPAKPPETPSVRPTPAAQPDPLDGM